MVSYLATFQNSGATSASVRTLASVNGGQAGESNRVLWVAVLWRDAVGQTCDDIDYGATNLTLSTGVTADGIGIRVGYLAAPAGTETVTVTFSADADMAWIVAKVCAGVHQTTPYASGPLYGSGPLETSVSTTITLPANGMILDALYLRGQVAASLAANADQVDDYSEEEVGFGSTVGTSHDSTSSNVGWSWTGGEEVHQVAVALADAAGAPASDSWAAVTRVVSGATAVMIASGFTPPDTPSA